MKPLSVLSQVGDYCQDHPTDFGCESMKLSYIKSAMKHQRVDGRSAIEDAIMPLTEVNETVLLMSRRALALAVTAQVSMYCNSSFHILAVQSGCTSTFKSVLGTS